MSTVFQQMACELREVMVIDSVGKGQSLALRPLPANNSVPGGAMIGIFDGLGEATTLVITAQGVAKLHQCTGEILAKGGQS